jgi:hypothetical protein
VGTVKDELIIFIVRACIEGPTTDRIKYMLAYDENYCSICRM